VSSLAPTVHTVVVKTRSAQTVELDRVEAIGDPATTRVFSVNPKSTISIDRSRTSPNYDSPFMGYRFIVLHHTASDNVSSVLNTLCNPANEVSSNYVVTKDGHIYELVAPLKRAWHAGAGSGFGVPADNMNAYSVGIEIVNAGDGRDPYPETQLAALQNLLNYLQENYGSAYVIDHKMWAPGRKVDMSANFPAARFGVGAYVTGSARTASVTDLSVQSDIQWIDIKGKGGERGDELWVPIMR